MLKLHIRISVGIWLFVAMVILFFFRVSAMDGIAVTVVSDNGYEIIAYNIANNAVKGKKVLCAQSQPLWSPSINPSGTHVVFYRGSMQGGKIKPMLSIANIETGIWKDICSIDDTLFGYVPVVWWLHDGSVIV